MRFHATPVREFLSTMTANAHPSWTASDNLLFSLSNRRYVAVSTTSLAQLSTRALNHLERSPLVTVVPLQSDRPWSIQLDRKAMKLHLGTDDVLIPQFLKNVLFATTLGPETVSTEMLETLKEFGNEWFDVILTDRSDLHGPYVFTGGNLKKVHRLYDDINGCFMAGIKYNETTKKFEDLRIGGEAFQSISVAVPGRPFHANVQDTPLAGLRIAVKDIFALRGIPITACNKAYYSLSSPSSSTAPCIQPLIDAGASIVGTTKLSSMISREEPTEAVDYQSPFNPRADGYQSPAGSSSGSASAAASYDWLDITIGTDSTGSSRRPAMVNGCFQLRVTHEALSLEGILPSFPIFDTPAFFGRDLQKMHDFGHIWLEGCDQEVDSMRQVLLYPLDYLPVSNESQNSILDSFIADLARITNTDVKCVSIADEWDRAPPVKANGRSLHEYLKDVGKNSYFFDFTKTASSFRKAYWDKYYRPPYVNKVTQWRWDEGQKISVEERDDAVSRLMVYKSWILDVLLQPEGKYGIMVLPIADAEPNYRDTPPGEPFAPEAWDPLFLAPILGSPEISLPIGDVKYKSRITDREESLPVAVSMLAPPRHDLNLLRLSMSVLQQSGRKTVVSTGKAMFP